MGHWFCKVHAAQYNKAWNFANMTGEVETIVRHDTVWDNPSGPSEQAHLSTPSCAATSKTRLAPSKGIAARTTLARHRQRSWKPMCTEPLQSSP